MRFEHIDIVCPERSAGVVKPCPRIGKLCFEPRSAPPVPDLQKAAGGCELVRAAPVPVEGAVQRLDAESQFSAEGGGEVVRPGRTRRRAQDHHKADQPAPGSIIRGFTDT